VLLPLVGRRNDFVTALASGAFPTKKSKAAVEMSGSRGHHRDADDATVPLDVESMSAAGPDRSSRAGRSGRNYAV
jgi:hypothetical protein